MVEEIKFLLGCAKLLRGEEDKYKIISLFKQNFNWNYLLNQSIKHHLAPLLYYNLKEAKVNVKHIPPQIMSKLQSYYRKCLHTNLKLQEELCIIQEALQESDIEVIPIRGITLIEAIYHNPALRPMADIDLLIKKEELPRFENIISHLGYQKAHSIQEEDYLRKWGSNLTFVKPSGYPKVILLEAHWAIIPPRPYKVKLPIWDKLISISLNGCNIKSLSIEDSLICFALHLRNHTRSLKLKHLIDITEWLRNYQEQIDWEYIISFIKEQKITYIFCFALLAANLMLDAPIPVEVRKSLPLSSLKSRMISKILNPYRFLRISNHAYLSNLQGAFLRILLFEHIYEIFTYPVLLRMLRGARLVK